VIDPVTAFAAANALFKGIQKGIAMGKEVESMAGSISKWYGMASDIRAADQKKRKPSAFKRFMDAGSVEQEALDSMLREKRLAEMEKALYDMILLQYGLGFYNEMMARRRKLKADREKEAKAVAKQREAMAIAVVVIVILGAGFYMLYWIISQAHV
jgi:hypothetical protein